MTNDQLKMQNLFNHLKEKMLPKDEEIGAFYEVVKLFPKIGAKTLQKLVENGTISPIPGTKHFLYAEVLWDLIANKILTQIPLNETTPAGERQRRIAAISADADSRLFARLNGEN